MGLFPKKDKHVYGDYSEAIIKENYSLSDEGIIPIGKRQDINHAPHALTPDEVKGAEPIKPAADIPMQSAGESLYKKMMDARRAENNEAEQKSEDVKKQTESLLSRCSQFVSDDKSSPILTSQPAYVLDSVESIIAEAERRAQERVKKLYGEDTADKAPAPPADDLKVESEKENEPEDIVSSTTPIEPEVIDEDAPVEGFRLPAEKPAEIPMEKAEVKNFQYRFADEDRSSEDDSGATMTFTALSDAEEVTEAEGNTVSFTPVTDTDISPADTLGDTMPVPALDLEFDANSIIKNIKDEEEPTEEELFGDYETAADAVPIEKELRSTLRRLRARCSFTLIIALFLTVLATPFVASMRENNQLFMSAISLSGLALCTLINIDVFKAFAGKAGSDLPAAISAICSLIFGAVCIATANFGFEQFGFIAAFSLLFSTLGKRNFAKRRLQGFLSIANDEEKQALSLIDETNGSYAIAHDAVEGEALIAAGRKTVNITRYLTNSRFSDPFSGKAVGVCIVTVLLAVLTAAYGFISDGAMQAFYLFTAAITVGAPLCSALIGTLPHKLAASKLSHYGAMLTSYAAAEEIEQTNAVVFDINSIFPRGRVKMYDMKVLSPNNLDETIFNAAAITTSINSPLGHVFRRIARTSDDYVLPPADSVKYENRLGISGWVGDNSVLIGNRTLMETHGVSVPSVEVDKKILRNGYFPVYVASNGKPCALLIVGYEADSDILSELRRLTGAGVVLLINNCDPNVTEEMLGDYFGLPEDFVKVMQSGSIRQLKEKTEFRESIPAKAAFSGGAAGIAAIVTAAIRIKRLTAVMAVLNIILCIAGVTAVAALAVAGFTAYLTPINLALYSAASLFIVLLAPLFYKP